LTLILSLKVFDNIIAALTSEKYHQIVFGVYCSNPDKENLSKVSLRVKLVRKIPVAWTFEKYHQTV